MTGYGGASTTERVLVNNDGLVNLSLLKIQSDPLGNLRDPSFDGDEMNVFVPQSIQTQIELEEIADVKRQIISPSSSSTSIGLVQDGLVGAYNLTGPTVKIDWRNAMNIISYTSFENMKKLDKERTFTGQEVFTLIIPPGININGDNNFKVKDSVLMEGSRLKKDVLGEKKKFALHQLIWDEYGPEETKTFIDNAQKLMNNFNLYNGFTVGYGDACVDKSVHENIDKLFVTINQKVDHMITELENNPEMMDKDVFEYKLQQEFGIVLDSVSKVVIASLNPDNSLFVMSDKGSGSKGSTTNIGQIIGCLGLQAIEGKIAPKKYNNRTLPYFHQHDDRGASRGLVREPYIDGLSFPSFTFLLMAGREGIIDQALKSVTGDTPIIIMENNNIKRINIGDWIDSHLKLNSSSIEHHEERQMELLKLKEKVYIPTTDFDGKVNWGEITAITRHDPGNELYEIKTKSGRNVIVTESKSLLIFDTNTNKLVHTSTPNVKVGDLVPVTKSIAKLEDINLDLDLSVRDLFLLNENFNSKFYEIQDDKLELNKNYKELNDVILDPIVSISKVDVNKYPKVYDLTIPSTLNFGLANGLHVVDTAETGYAQRRLVKSEEDVMIKYDCSVRTANEMLLQLVYGDSGADTTKQYLYDINMAKMSNEELKNKFLFSSDEMKIIKNFKSSDNDKIFNMIKSMRDEFRLCMRKSRCDFKTVVTKVAFPVNFTRIIDNISVNKSLQKGETVEPLYVHEQLEKILDNKYLTLIPMSVEQREDDKSIKNIDERVFKTFLKTALYNALAPKRCCIEKKFSKLQFDTIIKDIISTYNRSVVQPGEMVGIIGAQSMGEPLTQMSSSSLSMILIKNKSTGDIYYGKVGTFIDKILEDNKKDVVKVPKHKDSVIYKPKDDYYIIGVSDNEKTSWNKISEFSRHPANGQLMTITTKTKRTTTTTLSHAHLARKNHKVVPVKGSDLKVGDRIPVVLTIKMPEQKRLSIKIGEKDIKLDKNFGWFCGAYIADGCLTGNSVKITKINPVFEKRIKKIAKLFGKELKIRNYQGQYGPGKDQIFSHKDLATFLETNFGDGSYNKKIPAFAFDSNEEFVSGLIGGYFDGDGNFESKKCSIRVGSRSKELIEGLSILLSYFGIFGSFVDETTVNQPGKVLHTYQVMRKYDTTFKEKIFLCVDEKIDELDKLIEVNSREKKTNNNFVDMIEGLGESIAFIGKKLKLPGQSRLYGRWLKKPAIGRETLAKYVEIFTENLDKYKKVDDEDTTKEEVSVQLELLKQALTAEVVWDEIVSIDILDDPKEYVYDFTVPGNDSFMVDSGVLVHNTLNTFHVAGIKTMSSTTHGVPRVKEILGVSKNLRTPQLLMQLLPEFAKNKDMARKVASNLKYTTIGDIRGRINVYYDPEPDDENSIMKEDNVKQAFYNQKSSKTACQGDYKGLPWLMRIEIVKEKMLEKEISLLDIKSKFCNWWEKRFIDSKLLKKEEKKVINKITNISVLSNTDNDLQPVIHIRFNAKDADKNKDPFNREMLNEFIDNIIDKFKLKGIESITNINDIAPEKLMVVDESTGELKQEEHYMIYTAGTNLIDIRYLVGVDIYNTLSNDIVDVYKHFGIEIARTRLLRELYDAYDHAGHTVSYTNISVLVDIMTSNGILMSIDRHGMNKSDTDVLGRASFERAVDQILTAGVFGETDHMKGVSSRVMAGLVIKGGTGYCDVILDTNTIEKSEYSDETNKYRTHIDIITDGVAKDIMNNETGEMFIPE